MSTYNTHSACPTTEYPTPVPGTYFVERPTREDTTAAVQAAAAASGTAGHTDALKHAAELIRRRKACLKADADFATAWDQQRRSTGYQQA